MPVCVSRSFKTYIGAYNFVTEIGTVTARTEADDPAGLVIMFDASNLQKTRLLPQYRTDDLAVDLDGANDYAWVLDHADFDITSDLTIEGLVIPDAAAGTQVLLDKIDGVTGYRLSLEGDELRMSINGVANREETTGANLAVDTAYRVKGVYEAAAQTITLYVNGALEASATAGVIPAAITANNIRLTVGADAANANKLDGEIGFIGLEGALHNNGGYLDPSGCAGYWPMDTAFAGGVIEDVSGNDHDLTGVSLADTDFDFITTHAWVGFLLSTTSVPTVLTIDRRHNLTSSATVELFKGDWFSTYALIDTATVVAGEAIVLRDDTWVATDTQWWIEVHDPTNTDDFISLSYVWLGTHTEFSGTSFGEVLNRGETRENNIVLTRLTNRVTTTLSDPYRMIAGTSFPDLEGTDLAAVIAAVDAALEGKPLLVGYNTDDEGEHTRIMYLLNAQELLTLSKAETGIANAHFRRGIAFQELVAPAGYTG